MVFSRAVILLAIISLLSACVHKRTHGEDEYISQQVGLCAKHHNDSGTTVFSLIEAANLSYHIVFAETGEKRYCHIDKQSGELVYANGQNQVSLNIESEEYQKRYQAVSSGKMGFGKLKITSYKFIAGKWRYIHSRQSAS